MYRTFLISAGAVALGIVLVALGSTGVGLTEADVIGLVFFLLGGLLIWWLATAAAHPEDRHFLVSVAVGSQALRGIWCLLKRTLLAQFSLRYLNWEDSVGRDAQAAREAASWHMGLAHPHLPATLAQSHDYMVQLKTSILYYLFGPSPLLPEAVVATGTASICIAIYILLQVGNVPRKMRRLPVLLCALLPSFIFWHTLDNKDGVTATCAAWSLVGLLWIFQGSKKTLMGIPLLACMDLVALVYRPYVGILLMAGQGLAWTYAVRLPKTPVGRVTRIWLFIIMSAFAMWAGTKEMKDTYGQKMGVQWASKQYSSFWQGAQGHSAYEINIPSHNVVEDILGVPARVLLLLLSPIPVVPGSIRKMMTYPEQWFIYLYVVPAFYWGIRFAFRNRASWAATILLTVAPIILAYALKTSISGEAARMRTQFLSELFLFTGIGRVFIDQRKLARRAKRVPIPLWPEQPVKH